jgi:hypothetical protein
MLGERRNPFCYMDGNYGFLTIFPSFHKGEGRVKSWELTVLQARVLANLHKRVIFHFRIFAAKKALCGRFEQRG